MGTETTRYRIILDDRLSPGIRKATSNTRTFDNTLNKTNKSAMGLGSTLTRAFGGLAIGYGIYRLSKSIVTLGINMEQTRVAYGTFLKDVERGNSLMKELIEFSNRTPFETNKVLQSGKVLMGFGMEGNKVAETLKMLGDVSAGTGKDLSELGVIYGQIRGAGRLLGQDSLQLISAGFNPLQVIAEKTGVSLINLKRDMEAGLISFDMVQRAFKIATSEGGLFYKMTEKQSKTLGGRISTLVGKLQLLGGTIGEDLSGGMIKFTEGLISWLDSNSTTLVTQVEGIATAFGGIATSINDVVSSLGTLMGIETGTFFETFSIGLRTVLTFAGAAAKGLSGLALAFIGAVTQAATLGVYGKSETLAGEGLMKSAWDDVSTYFQKLRIEQAEKDGKKNGANGGVGIVSGKGEKIPGFGSFPGGPNDPNKKKEVVKTDAEVFAGLGLNPADKDKSKSKESAGSSVSGIQSKVRNITINIQKMVETINFNSITNAQSEAELVNAVKRALLTAVSDVNVISR